MKICRADSCAKINFDDGYGIVSTVFAQKCGETLLTALKMLLAQNGIIVDTCQSF